MDLLSTRLRRSELLLSIYFLYVSTVALFRPVAPGVRGLVLGVNSVLVVGFLLFSVRRIWARSPLLGHVRDWAPAPLILLAYKEMGWLALPHPSRDFENTWIGLDRALLDGGLRTVVESLGPLLPLLLELSYVLTYVVPVLAVAALYASGARGRLDALYLILLSATLAAYACYPWFPSDPPRTVFPGEDLPMMSALRRFNLHILGGYGIRTSVFPSGHSAASFAAAFALLRVLPERKIWGWGMMVLALLIAVATVYCRYHFAIDTVAGFGLALLAWGWSFTWRTIPPAR